MFYKKNKVVSFVPGCLCIKTWVNRWALTAREENPRNLSDNAGVWCAVILAHKLRGLYPPFFLGCCGRGHFQEGFGVVGWIGFVNVNSSCSQCECWRFAKGVLLISCLQAFWYNLWCKVQTVIFDFHTVFVADLTSGLCNMRGWHFTDPI